MKYGCLPSNDYVNIDKINNDANIIKYKTPDDKFNYKINTISDDETIYLNHLIMNEAFCYIGIKNPKNFLITLREYNRLSSMNMKNMHHNFNGFVKLLSSLSLK